MFRLMLRHVFLFHWGKFEELLSAHSLSLTPSLVFLGQRFWQPEL